MEVNATIFIMLFMFLFLLAWMSVILFKPFLALYDEREKRIEGAAETARQLTEGANAKGEVIEQKLRAANDDAREILVQLREKGAAEEQQIIQDAREKSQSMLEDARADLFAEAEEARAQLRATSEKLADDIAQRILGRAA